MKKLMISAVLLSMLPCSYAYSMDATSSGRFSPVIVDESMNFSDQYPDLDYGFNVLKRNFQIFVLKNWKGKNLQSEIIDKEGQSTNVATEIIEQARAAIMQGFIKNDGLRDHFGDAVRTAINGHGDIDQSKDPIVTYLFAMDYMQPVIKQYLNQYRCKDAYEPTLVGKLMGSGDNRYRESDTLLIRAIKNGNKKAIQFLIDAGADVTLSGTKWYVSPLSFAVSVKNIAIINLLLDAGATIHSLEEMSLGEKMYSKGINTNKTGQIIWKATGLPIPQNQIDSIIQELKNIKEYKVDEHLMRDIVDTNSPAILQLFIDKASLDVNWQSVSGFGYTLLYFAVKNQKVEMVKALIANGADVNKKNSSGETPLFEAVVQDPASKLMRPSDHSSSAAYEITKLLLDAGADVHVKNGYRETILSRVDKDSSSDGIRKLLLDAGAE